MDVKTLKKIRNTCAIFMAIFSLAADAANEDGSWIDMFNGRDLENWVPKFTGQTLGINYLDTFRVENGILKVSYENWSEFNGEFGHLIYKHPFSNYVLRLEYRFTGEQVKNGPQWAFRNNGVMIHGQAPESMMLDQKFPVSIEVQLLGGNGQDLRSTANVCSPSTNYVHRGNLITKHCTNSSSNTFHGDQWVQLEIEVHGHEVIRNRINGELVFEYSKPQLDAADSYALDLMNSGTSMFLSGGYISLQAESHPTEFRHIQLLPLSEN